jgi:hypothetical protein
MKHVKKSKPVKSKILTLRVTEQQFEAIEAAAKQANLNRTAYVEAIVSEIHPIEENAIQIGAYEAWFLMSSRWSRQRNAVGELTKRILSVDLIPEGMRILARLHDLTAESIELIDRLRAVTLDRK